MGKHLAHSVAFRPPDTASPDQHGLREVVHHLLVGHHLTMEEKVIKENENFTSVQNWSVS